MANTSLALWKHRVNLLLQTFRSVSSDPHQCYRCQRSSYVNANNALLPLMKIRAYGSNALQ